MGIGRGTGIECPYHNIGKIMVIDTLLTMNYWVRESAILATTFKMPNCVYE